MLLFHTIDSSSIIKGNLHLLCCALVCVTGTDDPEIPVSINAQHCRLTNHFLSEDLTLCLSVTSSCFFSSYSCLSHTFIMWWLVYILSSFSFVSLCQERRYCLWTPQIWTRLGSSVRPPSYIPCRAAHSSDSALAQVDSGTHIHTCPLTLTLAFGSHRPKALLNNSDNSQ